MIRPPVYFRRTHEIASALGVGIVIGVFLANPASLIAQGTINLSAWTEPPVVMSLVGVLLSVGVAWQMVNDDRRRLAVLETDTVRREAFVETMKRIDGSLDTLTKWAESDRGARR